MEDLLTGIGGGVVAIFAMIFAVIMMGFVMMFIGTLFMLFAELLMMFIELLFLPFTIIDFLVVLIISLLIPDERISLKRSLVFVGTALISGGLIAAVILYLSHDSARALMAGVLGGTLFGAMNTAFNYFEINELSKRLKKRSSETDRNS